MAGIYQIYNTETGKRYIGSSIDVERRLKEHYRNLKHHKHCNQHLQNAWNKYEEYLVFEPLEYCEPDECLKLEQQYIDYYDSANRENGYNIDVQAASAGKHLSEETKQKIREKAIGRKWSDEMRKNWLESNVGKKKPKQSETMKKKYEDGYKISRFTDVSEERQKMWRKNLSEGTKRRYEDYNNRPQGWYLKVTFETGSICFYPSLREAARQLNVDKSAIQYVLKNTNGIMGKLRCVFERITKEEYERSKSKK